MNLNRALVFVNTEDEAVYAVMENGQQVYSVRREAMHWVARDMRGIQAAPSNQYRHDLWDILKGLPADQPVVIKQVALPFAPKHHQQIDSGELAGAWMMSSPIMGPASISKEVLEEDHLLRTFGATTVVFDPKGDSGLAHQVKAAAQAAQGAGRQFPPPPKGPRAR